MNNNNILNKIIDIHIAIQENTFKLHKHTTRTGRSKAKCDRIKNYSFTLGKRCVLRLALKEDIDSEYRRSKGSLFQEEGD